MIKFIVSDLDGTLLPPSKIMPAEIFGLISQLHKRGIIFCPASGRQLPNLKKLFAPVIDKIAIIAENGCIGWYGGQVMYSAPMKKEDVKYALDIIRGEEGLYPLFSCEDCAYYEDGYQPFIDISEKSYSSIKKASLDEIAESQTVMKISVWDNNPPCAEHGGKVLPPKIRGLRTVVSGYDWIDVSAPTSNKGTALEAMLNMLGVDRTDCMAFGDHMNDLEMLQVSGHPYITENAFAGLKEIFESRVASNADYGVIKKLKELL